MNNPHLGELLHLISISLAFALAYIALDRFRYSKRVRDMYNDAMEKITKLEKVKDVQDYVLTQLRYRQGKVFKDGEYGLGLKLPFCKHRMFGDYKKSGWDVRVTQVFLILEFLFLVVSSLSPGNSDFTLYWIVVGICVIGAIMPAIYICLGTRIIKNNEDFIGNLIDDYAKYTASIAGLKDKVNPPQ